MLEFEILTRGFFRPSEVDIIYDPSLRMPIDSALQASIDELWQQQLAIAREQKFPLFDAPLFRLVHVEAQPGGALHLILGDTTYKEYTVSRQPVFAQGLSRQQLSNPLAICSVVETSDGFILYEQRQHVAVHAGRYHVIGGFFDRDADRDAQEKPDPFGAMRREIREETGIRSADIVEQYCLGAVYDIINPHAELCFLTHLRISLAEVLTRTPEDDEVKALRSLAVTSESLRAFLIENHGNISATGEPNLLLYGEWKYGERWLEEVMGQIDVSAPSC
ncbi:MAG TPA: NUDIX hydrolase [Ktedonobacteraceae bacterium]|nr:NUDIX hydrolase [Ktedonobacteraceae bacterium]